MPFQRFSIALQHFLFKISLLTTIVLTVVLQMVNEPLTNMLAPYGIVSFELAGDFYQAQQILHQAWGGGNIQHLYAAFSLGIDYAYLCSYSICISLACTIMAHRVANRYMWLYTIGFALAWGQFVAATLDAVENFALLRLLFGSQNEVYPQIALYTAIPKFVLVGLGILYPIVGWGLVGLKKVLVEEKEEL